MEEPLLEKQKKNSFILVLLSPKDKEIVLQVAESRRLSLSSYCREQILRQANKEKEVSKE